MRLKKQKNGFYAMVKDVIIKCKKCGIKRNITTSPRCPICKISSFTETGRIPRPRQKYE